MNTDPAPNPQAEQMATDPVLYIGMDLMLQHLSETNLQQQAVTQELAQSVHHPGNFTAGIVPFCCCYSPPRSLQRSPLPAHLTQQVG